MTRWSLLAVAAALTMASAAQAQDVKIGFILPMTGQQRSTGKQEAAAAKLYMAQHAKGLAWESPRGPVSIDPYTRDIVQDIYIRKVEKKNGELFNVEFATFPNVKAPIKAAEAK